MAIRDLLIPEFDEEMKKTRRILERVPARGDFAPHSKSMKLGQLAESLERARQAGHRHWQLGAATIQRARRTMARQACMLSRRM